MTMMTDITTDPRWARMAARDKAADGSFVYSVATTGVYCRPSCAARRANPRNVMFHAGPAEAEAAGFRACRRCRPNEQPDARIVGTVSAACRAIDAADEIPSLADLAAAAELSPGYFHRVFKAATGVTPRVYAAARRAERLRDELPRAGSVTEAIYGAGFSSSGRFYAASDEMLGMAPRAYRKGGADTTIRFAVGDSALGAVLVASSERGVCAVTLGDDADGLLRDLQDRFPRATLLGGDADYEALAATVIAFVEAPERGLDLPLDMRGTAFQQRVWQALRAIPAGATASYAEIAARIGSPASVRAVAGACAANAIAVAIPCHRVVRTDGALSGYRWGIERKRELLRREALSSPASA